MTLLVGAPAAHAATITVDTTADELNSDGDCSLREAIQAANTDTAVDACSAGTGADVISVPAGTYPISIVGSGENANATGDFDILSDVTILGAAGTVVDGAARDRVMHFISGVVAVQDISVQSGGVVDETCEGGGIYNQTIATLNRVVVSRNQAGDGGGIHNAGTLTISGSRISENIALLGKRAGGITNGGTLIIDKSVIADNAAPRPAFGGAFLPPCIGLGLFGVGGIFNNATLTIRNSTLTGNRTGLVGGGAILNYTSGVLSVEGTTFSRNVSEDRGGGMENGGTATLVNSTFSGNTAVTQGGAISAFAGVLTLDSATVTENASNFGAGGIDTTFFSGGVINAGQSIVANNSSDCAGTINSTGYNLIEDPSGCTIGGDTATNITGVDPMLGPLGNNGGPTETHELLTGSPAIDAGRPACPPPATDQRGVTRPQGSRCDIGAFELELARDILFASSRTGNGDIYSIDPGGGTPTQLTSGNAIDAEPEWSPDGSKIAFTSTRDGNVEIYVMDSDGSDVTRLTTHPRIDTSPAWYGTKIAFASNRASGNWDIYTMDADDGGNVMRLTMHSAADTLPAWSPNGGKIAFTSTRSGGSDIYSMYADGSLPIRLTTSPRVDTEPAWSGSTIAFSTNRDAVSNFEIYTMNDDGALQTRRTTQAGQDVTPAWSLDGSKLAFATNRHGAFNFEIYTMDADGTDQTRLTTNPALDVFPDW